MTSVESVATDVASFFQHGVPSLGKLADLGLYCFSLHATAYSASEALAEHIVSAVAYGRNTDSLLSNTLKAIYTAPTGWVGNETLSAAVMVLRVLASVPDSRQRERINFIMQCNERPTPHAENGVGLLVAARAFYVARQGHTYPNEMSYAYDRYVGLLKELLALQGVFIWMTENRSLWTWMERDLLDSQHHPTTNHGQMRTDYTARREGDIPGVPMDHHPQSDSEGMPEINDSEEEDDEDSRFDEMDTYGHGPAEIIVEGAGNPAVNGVFTRDGFFERASRYNKVGEYHGEQCLFSLFQCNVSNNTKHWYISIVPGNGHVPGTSADTDFYSAPVTETCTEFPPLSGWTKSNEGRDPPPTLIFKEAVIADDPETDRVPGPGGWDENNGGPHQNGRQTYI